MPQVELPAEVAEVVIAHVRSLNAAERERGRAKLQRQGLSQADVEALIRRCEQMHAAAEECLMRQFGLAEPVALH